MPEARDRRSRPNDVIADIYSRRLTSVGRIETLPDLDDNDRRIVNQTPFRWGSTPLTGGGLGHQIGATRFTRSGVAGAGIGLFGTPTTNYRRGRRNQNSPPFGGSVRRGRIGRSGNRSVLPSWYPRTPLGDITHVVRAIERRRARLGDGDGQVSGSPTASDAQLEHDLSLVTPKPNVESKVFKPSNLGKVSLSLADIVNQNGSEFETPQKKLLNSIDIVEKVVMEELGRLKRTPAAKKAEREKKVRTLMSMR
ncbi:protein POLYCHOME-like [Rutidosis leptorrhynchoides]|uniref:protein POLYCHOME-like n=1 Tax=Rutidosis leptorrhynchoides TaxID=125765 RepID=UPI003A992C9F